MFSLSLWTSAEAVPSSAEAVSRAKIFMMVESDGMITMMERWGGKIRAGWMRSLETDDRHPVVT